jgi:hypothetical protein
MIAKRPSVCTAKLVKGSDVRLAETDPGQLLVTLFRAWVRV